MVGKNIKKFRSERGMTQEELAEKLSVTRQAISNWETEKTQPDIDTLVRISAELDISAEELIYGTKNDIVMAKGKDFIINGSATGGIGFGAALAMIISYVKWESVGWAILHGFLNWFYVIYYLIKY